MFILNKRRVVVTGLGMVSPLGSTIDTSWQAALAGKSGVKKITHFDASPYTTHISAPVLDFDPTLYMDPKEIRRTDFFIHYAMAATTQAMKDANLTIHDVDAYRAGVLIGSGIGGLPMIESSFDILKNQGPRRVSPFFIPGIIINMASGYVSIAFGCKGPNLSISTACATGTHSIGQAARMIAFGDADVMLAGGTEMASCHLGIAGFAAMRALSTRNDEPEKASRPWDKDRDGFVLGDGAGMLVLESYEHAKARGAKIYAEVAGFAMTADAEHITAPSSVGGQKSMEFAVRDAGLSLTDIHYINAHATSTEVGDLSEINAIKAAFGAHANQLAISSTKSMTGHLLGAAGAVEAIFSILALRDHIAPPTINLDSPSEGCDLNLVPNKAQTMKINAVLSNSFGFGGTNTSVVFTQI